MGVPVQNATIALRWARQSPRVSVKALPDASTRATSRRTLTSRVQL